MRILLLDGGVNPAVAAVRSLAKAGHRVIVGSTSRWSKAAWSRGSSGTFTYPKPEESAEEFAAAIATEAGREGGALVLPLTEKTVMALSERRAMLEQAGGGMVMPSHSVMLKAYDKSYTTRLASHLGVASPRTCVLATEDEARRIAENFPYPAALKATTSVMLAGGTVKATARTLYARDSREFLQRYHELRNHCEQVIAQEFISGEGVLYCLLLCRGELRAEFAYRRLRSVHPTGWGAALRVSVPALSLRASSLSIIRGLDPQWSGLACVEYRVRRDGTAFFLEVNPRAWNSLALAVYSGIDFPRMLAEIAEYGDVTPHTSYPSGVVCRWWLGDLRRLVYVWQGVAGTYPEKTQGRFAALMDFLKPVPHAFHDNFNTDDPMPELGDWLAAAERFFLSLRSTNNKPTGSLP